MAALEAAFFVAAAFVGRKADTL